MKFVLGQTGLERVLGDSNFIDKGVDKITGSAQNALNDHIVAPFVNHMIDGFMFTLHGITNIMPELTVLIVIILITIGMFDGVTKWGLRAALVFLGGAVWLTLA